MKTTTQVRTWGNSLAIRIPSRIARDLGLLNDSLVEITSDGTKATIKREKDPAPSLDMLVKGITHENVHDEMGWGAPLGREIW